VVVRRAINLRPISRWHGCRLVAFEKDPLGCCEMKTVRWGLVILLGQAEGETDVRTWAHVDSARYPFRGLLPADLSTEGEASGR
jgi:hypothetical protein